MRAIVCGGRDETSRAYVWGGLDGQNRIEEITELAHGGATGVDSLAHVWATNKKIVTRVYRAKWKELGLAAGPKRNQQMLESFKPDAVIAFAGGRGTAHMVRIAEKAGVKVIRVSKESTSPEQRVLNNEA